MYIRGFGGLLLFLFLVKEENRIRNRNFLNLTVRDNGPIIEKRVEKCDVAVVGCRQSKFAAKLLSNAAEAEINREGQHAAKKMPWLRDSKSASLTASPTCCIRKLNPRSNTDA